MRKNYYLYFVVPLIVGMLVACVNDDRERSEASAPRPGLSVDQARMFFENNVSGTSTRAAGDGMLTGIFASGEVIPDWTRAETSSDAQLACVDIPSQIDNYFQIGRLNSNGEMGVVPAYNKLLVVRDRFSGELASYMHFFIPEELYNSWYDGDLSEMFLNCGPRDDFSGVELYTTLEGVVAAAARYVEGQRIDVVFMGERRLPIETRLQQLRTIMRGLYIMRRASSLTRAEAEWWDFGGKSCFRDSTGALYFVVTVNNIKYATMDFDGTMGDCDENGNVIGGSGGSGDGSGGGSNGPGNGTGGSGGPNGNGNGDKDKDGNDNGDFTDPNRPDKPDGPKPPKPPTNPTNPGNPGKPIKPGGGSIGGGGGGNGHIVIVINPIPDYPDIVNPDEKPEEDKPCFDLDSVRANPLLSMEILGTKINKKAGGRFGKGRGKQHNGIDLDAPVGTPVYAMFDGKITSVVDKYDPDLPYDQYENVYSNDESSNYDAGNRIWIESDTPKGKILIKYFHLDSITVKKGDPVIVGTEVGFTGATGSACCSASAGPHLHLEVYVNGKRVDPELFLYTQFDRDGESVTKDCNEK